MFTLCRNPRLLFRPLQQARPFPRHALNSGLCYTAIRSQESTAPLPPRQFPTTGFAKLDPSEAWEEEQLPYYEANHFYPVRIGEVFLDRYQVVAKLGYGTSSTVWLCRDLQTHGYRTLKVCAQGHDPVQEVAVSEHLKNAPDHAGRALVRLVLRSFVATGPHGKHRCLVYKACGMNMTKYMNGCTLPTELGQRSLQLTLIALSFLHANQTVHTDVSPNNILQKIDDSSMLSAMEEEEMTQPIARKVLADHRTIYRSRAMPACEGLPVLSDLGEARFGHAKYQGDIMPGIYRAPEVILGMEWDDKVDIWSVGVMAWDLLQDEHLFSAKTHGVLCNEQHLAELVSLMGPPPRAFIQRSSKCARYFDEQGNWKGSLPIPHQSLDSRIQHFHGAEKRLFLNFLRRIFRWLPEERPSAEELAHDEFLMQPILAAKERQTQQDSR
ncbi:CMGC/CLK protein kinase [Aspergillus saccharolyticus JOP 1030-1]|uniref:CMGC/CLK protein kinase n=1 Tax=Aspergillus saccharolyticus JOP 1030-1 TaxID=1450539 RepID=A0A318ZTT7_9EURO|nr:CMGC/CLK protein kinase [Aspergillus saccharolyticus JOP 1030-1]PYH50065.1 CMGC/CLK protein kinase [Aspergillus saccharolyticus JOP 1030-1]